MAGTISSDLGPWIEPSLGDPLLFQQLVTPVTAGLSLKIGGLRVRIVRSLVRIFSLSTGNRLKGGAITSTFWIDELLHKCVKIGK